MVRPMGRPGTGSQWHEASLTVPWATLARCISPSLFAALMPTSLTKAAGSDPAAELLSGCIADTTLPAQDRETRPAIAADFISAAMRRTRLHYQSLGSSSDQG